MKGEMTVKIEKLLESGNNPDLAVVDEAVEAGELEPLFRFAGSGGSKAVFDYLHGTAYHGNGHNYILVTLYVVDRANLWFTKQYRFYRISQNDVQYLKRFHQTRLNLTKLNQLARTLYEAGGVSEKR